MREIDGVAITPDEQELWEERVAICIHDGLVSREMAEIIADESVRNMRRKREQSPHEWT